MSRSIVAKIIPDTCQAFLEILHPEVMAVPDQAGWAKIAADFQDRWQFSHCIGSINGKRVIIQAPINACSLYFNYKKSHSIVLLAVVDARYNFVVIDVGAYGRQCDSSVVSNSNCGKMLKGEQLCLPYPKPFPSTTAPSMSYVIVRDEAFL